MPASAGDSEGSSDPAGAAANDEDIAFDHPCIRQVANGNHRGVRIAIDRNPHDIDQSFALTFHG